jgi:hypothetical protein
MFISINDIQFSSKHLQGCSLGYMSLTPLRQLLRCKREMTVTATGRIYEYALISDAKRLFSGIEQ